MSTKDAPHGRGMAWATLLVSAAISLGVNLWHAFDKAPGHQVTPWFAALAALYGTAPVVLAAFQSHSAAFVPMGRAKRALTYLLVLLGMVLSVQAQAAAVAVFAGDYLKWVFPILVDLSAFMALHTLMESARAAASGRPVLIAPTNLPVPHRICSGPDGLLQLRRPKRRPAPTDLGVKVGERVYDLESVLSGPHSPVVYFIANGDRVKIGTSTNLRKRVRALALRVENVVLLISGDSWYEGALHKRFADYRDGDSEWFRLAGDVEAFVKAGGQPALPWPPNAAANSEPSGAIGDGVLAPSGGGANKILAATVGSSGGEVAPTDAPTGGASGDSEATEPAPIPRQRQPRSGASKSRSGAGRKRQTQRTRRSMTEWVELAGPLFHQEMDRLHRQPTGDEFAEAIERAGLGSVSPSTAKNIRTEILDRAPVPALDDLS